jgi:hypothetical protein
MMPEQDATSCDDMRCVQCKRVFAVQDRIASISGSIMGDEHTDSYFLCPACNVYTVFRWWDDFMGVETVSSSGPVSREEGDARAELIGKCDRSWDKHCRCEAHNTYFGGSLD